MRRRASAVRRLCVTGPLDENKLKEFTTRKMVKSSVCHVTLSWRVYSLWESKIYHLEGGEKRLCVTLPCYGGFILQEMVKKFSVQGYLGKTEARGLLPRRNPVQAGQDQLFTS